MVTLDLTGEVCPYTFLRAKLELEELPLGASLEILVDFAPAAENVPRSLRAEGQEVVSVEKSAELKWRIVTVKRKEHPLKGMK
jgi:tRNA 2-thiouridine synthesizing protein A